MGKKSQGCSEGKRNPEFYTFPINFIRKHHNKNSSWEKVNLGSLPIEPYRDDLGSELIAQALEIDYPARPELCGERPSCNTRRVTSLHRLIADERHPLTVGRPGLLSE